MPPIFNININVSIFSIIYMIYKIIEIKKYTNNINDYSRYDKLKQLNIDKKRKIAYNTLVILNNQKISPKYEKILDIFLIF